MKNVFLSFLSLLFLGAAAAAITGGWAIHEYLSPSSISEPQMVIIEHGMSVSQIANKLEEENIIAHPLIFKVAARVGNNSLKAGEYQFPAQASLAEIMNMMEEGKVFDRKITIPEGLTSYQVVKLLNERDDLSGEITDIPKEGSLLPDTYHFVKDESRQEKINQMQIAMTKAIDELWETRAKNLPFNTKEEALILASIVEKETGVAKERERVAGVFINRLKRGIPLQTDPTVIYAITKGKIQDEGKGPLGRRLLSKDLQIDSAYNTYKNAGLPPGPIANPGYASIKATLNPEQHDYIYFVADGTGGHSFSKTLDEHNQNVAKWRKVRP